MADYVMLEDIFETTENMTVLRDNSYNDDGTDTVAGVDCLSSGKQRLPIFMSAVIHGLA